MFVQLTKILNEYILSPQRWKYLVKHLSPYLNYSQKILDVGAGDGGLANELAKKLGTISITGVDVYLQLKTFIPITQYDGKTLPFPNNSFDNVMIVDVLHHDEHPEHILQEAQRVSKKYILIKDHFWKNSIDFSLLKWTDYLGNLSYGVNLPYNYLTMTAWQKLFRLNKLKIMKQSTFRYNFFDPCKHVVFLLKK